MLRIIHLPRILFIFLFIIEGNTVFSQSAIYGTTQKGGTHNAGIIFSLPTGTSSYDASYNFTTYGAANPYNDLTEASNGKLYGLTEFGGSNNEGVLFEYDPISGFYTEKHSFSYVTGSNPKGSLVEANNGKLYGMTRWGSTSTVGALFEFDPSTNIYTKKLEFTGTDNGAEPFGSMILASDGKLYGLTTMGGTSNEGILFEYDPTTNTLTKKADFTNSVNGAYPYGKLLQASNGKLYGITSSGGMYNFGCLFEFDISSGILTKKIDFSGSIGNDSHGSLIELSDGKLYGMTTLGGYSNVGVIFQYDPASNTIIKMATFVPSTTGGLPYGSLMQSSSGKIYGMTTGGSTSGYGAIFEFDVASKSITVKGSFEGKSNGGRPFGSLIQASNGSIYGLTLKGGNNNVGVLFEFNVVNNTIIKKHDFTSALNGRNPEATLLFARNGKLYGTTSGGGNNDAGVLFEYDPYLKSFTKKVDFEQVTFGSNPEGKLVQAANGKLYGVTTYGGVNDLGVLFEYDVETNTLTKKFDFDATSGGYPEKYLSEISDNKLYGSTIQGAVNGYGAYFEYDIINNSFTVIKDYVVSKHTPTGRIFKTSDNKYYGLTTSEGGNQQGSVYEYSVIDKTASSKFDFEMKSTGAYPNSVLSEFSNGKFYGSTQAGGTNSLGVLFEYDHVNNLINKIFEFSNYSSGVVPNTAVIPAVNGKLYGTTYYGGTRNRGVLFEFDLVTSQYSKKIDFALLNGETPVGDLTEVCLKPASASSISGPVNICLGTLTLVNLSIDNLSNADNYLWTLPEGAVISSGGNTNSIQVDFSKVTQGKYTISVSGSNVCGLGNVSSLSIDVNPIPSVPQVTIIHPVCDLPTGSAEIVIQNVADQYSFNNGISYQSSNSISELVPGNYVVEIKNQFGCSSKKEITVNPNPRKPAIPEATITHPTCDVSTGSIEITVQNNNDQYSFDNGVSFQSTNKMVQMVHGNHVIIIKSLDDCLSNTKEVTINPPLPVPAVPEMGITHPTCTVSTGAISVTTQNADDQYSFDNGASFQNSNIKANLNSGEYKVIVKNNAGCSANSIALILPDPKPAKPSVAVNLSNPAEPVLSTNAVGTYKWYLNGVLLSDIKANSHAAKTDGVYTLVVIANGCESDPSDPVSIVILGLGNEKDFMTSGLVYPNPSSGEIWLSGNSLVKGESIDISIYSTTGKRMYYSSKILENDPSIDIANFPDGVYIIVVEQKGLKVKNQFIKRH